MAHSKTSICNAGLGILGKPPLVVDADGDAVQEYDWAAQAVAAYDQRIGRVLRSFPWNFAMERAALEADATAPAFKYTYRYALPAGAALWDLDENQVGRNPDYQVESGFILINQSGPLNVRYIKRETDPAKFSDEFADALAHEIAKKIAVGVLGSIEAADWLRKVSKEESADAKAIDSHENPPQTVIGGSWAEGRRTG